jgi:hypothetical protein
MGIPLQMYVASVTLGLLNNSVSTTGVIGLNVDQSRNIIKNLVPFRAIFNL